MGVEPWYAAGSPEHIRRQQRGGGVSPVASRRIKLMAGLQLPYTRIFIIAITVLCVAGMYLYVYYHPEAGG